MRDLVFKVILLGDGGVGKTTLFKRIKTGKFEANVSMTIGVEFHVYDMKRDDLFVRLSVWDLAGQNQFRKVIPSYRSGAQAAIVMYDLTRFSTLKNMEEWIKFAREENPQMPILMVGAKLDLKDMINVTDEIRAPYLKKYAFNHIMVSSKTGEGVPEMLNLLVDELIKTKVNPKPNP